MENQKHKNLPKYWVAKRSKKYNKSYYFNTKTAEKSWKHPLTNSSVSENENSKAKTQKRSLVRKKNDCDNKATSPNKIKRLKSMKKIEKNKIDENCNMYINPLLSNEIEEPQVKKKRITATANISKKSMQKEVVSSKKNNNTTLLIQNIEPMEIKDVEMIDLTIDEEEVIEIEETSCCIQEIQKTAVDGESESNIIVIDTNILLSQVQLNILSVFSSNCENQNSRNIVVIPWTVLQELDGLKKSKPKASEAISFLNRQFSKLMTCLRGQTIFEAAIVIDGFTPSNNDDDILHCCLAMQMENKNHKVILCSADKNLNNKALVHKIRCKTDLSFLNKHTKNKNIVPKDLISKKNPKSNYSQAETMDVIPVGKNTDKEMSPSTMCNNINDIMRTCMGEILKQEMITIYGEELWQDIVIIKPPWSLNDLFKCFKKHWLALFAQLQIPRVAQDLLQEIIAGHNDNYDLTHVLKYCKTCLAFLNIVQKYGKYTSTVVQNIQHIENICDNLKQNKTTNNKPTGTTTPEINMKNSRDIEHAQTSYQVDVFWLTLDKIWSAIMCHCVIVFQSGKFLPSQERLSDDLKQGLMNKYENIPPPEVAARSLPLITHIVKNLLTCLEKFMASPLSEMAEALQEMLHYLWMITRGFNIQSDLHRLENLERLQYLLINDESSQGRLKCGHSQLLNIYLAAEECAKHFKII